MPKATTTRKPLHSDWEKVKTQLPPELMAQVRLLAVQRGLQIREVIRIAVERFINETKRKR